MKFFHGREPNPLSLSIKVNFARVSSPRNALSRLVSSATFAGLFVVP